MFSPKLLFLKRALCLSISLCILPVVLYCQVPDDGLRLFKRIDSTKKIRKITVWNVEAKKADLVEEYDKNGRIVFQGLYEPGPCAGVYTEYSFSYDQDGFPSKLIHGVSDSAEYFYSFKNRKLQNATIVNVLQTRSGVFERIPRYIIYQYRLNDSLLSKTILSDSTLSDTLHHSFYTYERNKTEINHFSYGIDSAASVETKFYNDSQQLVKYEQKFLYGLHVGTHASDFYHYDNLKNIDREFSSLDPWKSFLLIERKYKNGALHTKTAYMINESSTFPVETTTEEFFYDKKKRLQKVIRTTEDSTTTLLYKYEMY